MTVTPAVIFWFVRRNHCDIQSTRQKSLCQRNLRQSQCGVRVCVSALVCGVLYGCALVNDIVQIDGCRDDNVEDR